MFTVTRLKLKVFHSCFTGTKTTFPPCLDPSKCNGHVIYKLTIAMSYVKIYGFKIKDFDIIAEDF